MANWCNNYVYFSGDPARVEDVRALFREIQGKQDRDEKLWLPFFVTNKNGYMIDIDAHDEEIYYRSRWVPNIDVLVQIANHYAVDFLDSYDELQTGVFGEANYDRGVLSNISLDGNDLKASHYDEETRLFIYKGQSYEDERPIFAQLIEQKRLNDHYFKTTNSITQIEVHHLYGELTEGDLLLKFAEHKDFDQARKVFEAMDEQTIIAINNFLVNIHRDRPGQFATRDKFFAFHFLKHLIRQWNDERRHQRPQTSFSR